MTDAQDSEVQQVLDAVWHQSYYEHDGNLLSMALVSKARWLLDRDPANRRGMVAYLQGCIGGDDSAKRLHAIHIIEGAGLTEFVPTLTRALDTDEAVREFFGLPRYMSHYRDALQRALAALNVRA